MMNTPFDYFEEMYGSLEMRRDFSDDRRFQCWLDVEAALARTQARLGLIPVRAAEEIRRKALEMGACLLEYVFTQKSN